MLMESCGVDFFLLNHSPQQKYEMRAREREKKEIQESTDNLIKDRVIHSNESICQVYLSMNKSMSTCHAQSLIDVGRHLRNRRRRKKSERVIVSEKKNTAVVFDFLL